MGKESVSSQLAPAAAWRLARGLTSPSSTWTSETVRWQVSSHHQSLALGGRQHPRPAVPSSPVVLTTSWLPRAQEMPSPEVASPAGQLRSLRRHQQTLPAACE